MNIKQAKEQIKNAMTAYFSKDETGEYMMPAYQQRPVFLMGPPGIGKTAIMEQVASEMGVALLSYSMTHHTRQSALGLRPLYDALYDFMGVDSYQKLLERGVVEVAPLAYMRGRTLSDSFIILDEAQNTTSEQMKMFLTRLGFHSKVVVTGDITQTDLPYGKKSGLAEAIEILKDIPEIGMVHLTHKDVVRHELVQTIVKAYDAYYHREAEGQRP